MINTLLNMLRRSGPGIFLLILLHLCPSSLMAQQDQNNNDDDSNNDHSFISKDAAGDSLILSPRHIPDSILQRMQRDDDFWYANAKIKEKEKKPDPKTPSVNYVPLGQRTWFKTLLWLIIIGGFAGALMWYLAGSNVGLLRKRSRQEQGSAEEGAPEDIFAINYEKEIAKALQAENYRLVVRLRFLHLLKIMAGKNIIQYKQDRTNFDYLMQLHSTSWYERFFRITRNYEYSWYGQFEVSKDAYRIISGDFDHLESSMQ